MQLYSSQSPQYIQCLMPEPSMLHQSTAPAFWCNCVQGCMHETIAEQTGTGCEQWTRLTSTSTSTFSREGFTVSTEPTGTPLMRTGVPTPMPHAKGNSRTHCRARVDEPARQVYSRKKDLRGPQGVGIITAYKPAGDAMTAHHRHSAEVLIHASDAHRVNLT